MFVQNIHVPTVNYVYGIGGRDTTADQIESVYNDLKERNEEAAKDNSKLWPGFIALPLTDDIKKELKIEDKNIKGIIVSSVQPKSPASSLRIQNSDIITAVNGKKINSVAEFYKELDTNGKKEIWFDIYSDGHTISTGHFKF